MNNKIELLNKVYTPQEMGYILNLRRSTTVSVPGQKDRKAGVPENIAKIPSRLLANKMYADAALDALEAEVRLIKSSQHAAVSSLEKLKIEKRLEYIQELTNAKFERVTDFVIADSIKAIEKYGAEIAELKALKTKQARQEIKDLKQQVKEKRERTKSFYVQRTRAATICSKNDKKEKNVKTFNDAYNIYEEVRRFDPKNPNKIC